ncbi:hypothetical protein ACIBCN_39800 [Nocardia sp. NPDC051052]|uniref:hypothetical protein n=1 Tax=Nocardia sp. NPDC051052 TaxID=3364322 RepID=UPI0037916834
MTVVHLFDSVFGFIALAPWRLRLCVVAGLIAALVWWVGSWVVRESDTAQAVWVRITPPAHLPPEASVRFARSLAGVLHRTRRYGWRPRYVACEFVATDTVMSLGVWVPPTISPQAVISAVTGAWPGARAVVSAVPGVLAVGGVRGREVLPRGGEWSPVVEPSGPAAAVRAGADAADPLGQVLTMLARRGPGEAGWVQVIVAAQRGTRSGRPALRALDAVLAFVEEMGREFTRMNGRPSAGTPPRVTPAVDPVQTVRSRAIVAKKASGPHLRVTVRVAVAGPAPAWEHRSQAGLIADGYDAVATAGDGLITRRVHRSAAKVSSRRPGTGFAATVAEMGALWHIPADAALYGIDTTDARTRAPHRDLPRLETPQANSAETARDSLGTPRNRPETPWTGLDDRWDRSLRNTGFEPTTEEGDR